MAKNFLKPKSFAFEGRSPSSEGFLVEPRGLKNMRLKGVYLLFLNAYNHINIQL